MKQSGSDVHVFKLASEYVEDVLNTDFNRAGLNEYAKYAPT